ncbi:uncharacterized protein LOC129941297 isoform X2 [Eupeodes corollae]|uniref:uncharacterized protein LOC129941297 isoform X2 n=1 Tax=Eupeodes corollae TaxID=290404 RepID=UPI002490B68D|nr:uncharacterized protein LOC129941297 isoform X2 [Eupeodes corollae]
MTIKPVGSQKSADGGKKDSHGHVQVVVGGEAPNQNVVRSTHRNVVIDSHAAQSPQRRGDVYEEISRHRRSPHKSGRPKREHHKREKNTSTVQKCISPHRQTCVPVLSNKPPIEQQQSPLSTSPCQAQDSVDDITTASLIKAVEEAYSGYNSGDEHLRNKEDIITPDEWRLRDEQFDKLMSEQGFIVQNIEEDGACLFRAISLQIYGDEEMHDQIRQQTMDYLYKNREYYSQFVTEDINSYIKRKRKKDSHGNHIEIQLMSELYNRPIELYCYKSMPINIFNSEQQNNGYPPLRLAYMRGSHYNAIIDPFNATVGVGLGLAGYKPELQTKDAMVLSEQLEIEQTMFEDKLKTTDWEATNEAIEEQIARESYLQWCRENMQQKVSGGELETTTSSNYASGSGGAANTTAAATTTATVTSAEAAAIASPSKYHQHRLRSSTCTVTNENLNSSTSSTSSVGSVPPVPAPSPASAETSTTITPAALSALNVGNLSPKSLTAFAQSLRKDSELCFDSDDTDMSSTSSIDHPSGEKGANRGKKSKNRGANSRLSKRRRREVAGGSGSAGTELGEEKDSDESEKITTPKQQKATKFCDSETKKLSRPTTPITCSLFFTESTTNNQQQISDEKPATSSPIPSSSSTSCSSSPGTSKQVSHRDATFFSSSPPPTSALPLATASASTPQKPVSSFYQSLLESSYVADGTSDGFAQLSESEMLQQAIQLSTQEYLEDQKRKGGLLL